MKTSLISRRPKTFVLVFEPADEVVSGLKRFARENHLGAAQFTAIGAFSDAVLGFFNVQKRGYKKIPITEQAEVLSLLGDITVGEDGPQVHAHVVLGKSDGTAHGGHLIEAHVRPTLEVILTESPAQLHRAPDAATGLAVIKLDGAHITRGQKRTNSGSVSKRRSGNDARTMVE